MHKSFTYLLLIALVISCFVSAYGQTISPEVFENQEDLKDALERGIISYEEYLEFSELMSDKIKLDSDEKYKLLVIPGVSWGDLVQKRDELYSQEEKISGFVKEPESKVNATATWQTYQKLKEEEGLSNRFSFGLSHKKFFDFNAEFSQEGERSLGTRRRSIRFFLPRESFGLTVGNYDKRFGLGINIGYYSFLNYIRDDTLGAQDQFLYPLRARYNGFLAEYQINHIQTSVFYSANRWSDFMDWLWGGDLSWSFQKMDLGATFSWAKMKRAGYHKSYEDRCISLHLETNFKTTNLLAEYAKMLEAGEGVGLVFLSETKNYSLDWSFWNYASNFIHLHNGGPSQSDYESTKIEEIDYTFKSRQAGERGINFVSRYKLTPSLRINLGYAQWSENRGLPQKMRAKIGASYSLWQKQSFILERYWIDNDLEQEELDGQKTGLGFEISPFSNFKLRIMADYGEKSLTTGKRKYGDIQFRISSSVISFSHLTLWLKCYDPNLDSSKDGIWRFYLEQNMKFFKANSFILGLGAKYSRSTNSIEDKSVRTKLSINW
jgi:hypothetical protein